MTDKPKTFLPADPDLQPKRAADGDPLLSAAPNPAPPAERQILVGDHVRSRNGTPFRGSYDAVMGRVVNIEYGAASHRPMPHDVMSIATTQPAQYSALRDELVLMEEGEKTSPPAADAPKDQEGSELKIEPSVDMSEQRESIEAETSIRELRSKALGLILLAEGLMSIYHKDQKELARLNDVIASLNAEVEYLNGKLEGQDAQWERLRQEMLDYKRLKESETRRADENGAYGERMRGERDAAKLLAATRLEEIVDLREAVEQHRRYENGLSRENEETHERWGKACVTAEDQRERADVWQRSTQDALSQVAELRGILKGERERNANLERALERQHQDMNRCQGQLTMLLKGLDEGAGIKADDASRLFCLPIVNHRGEHRVMRLLASSCRLHHDKDERYKDATPKVTGYDIDRQALRTVEIEQLRKSDS